MMLGGTTTGVVLLLAVLGSSTTGPAQFRWGLTGAEATAFLESSLPLKPLVSTPVELLKGNASAAVTISGRQAITVVYSRPVIALGSDFGKADNFGGKVPFTLTCAKGPVPAGKFRWVTTTIARFDPDVDWPTDLDCEFAFNDKLAAYDGAVVKLSSSTSRRLRTQPLAMSFSGVTSETAEKLTGGDWSGTIGMPDDALPEVPPDGVVTLSFSYPVNLALIRAALQLQPNPNGVKLNITRCVTPANWWPRGANTPATPQEGDDGCVAVAFSGPLKDETKYQLVLPAGSKYSNLTGPTTQAQTVGIAGLRAFRVPIRQDFQKLAQPSDGLWDGVSYRRLKMWLPHGLKQASDVTALVGQVSLCKVERPFAASSDCTPVPINSGKLVSPAFVQLQVNGLMPRTRYRVSVQASSSILDGYNKPLQASQGEFWTMDVSPYFSAPDVPVAVFDQDTLPASWPYMAYGTDPLLNTAQVWSLDVSGEPAIRKLVQVLNGASILVKDVLGTPTDQVGRGSPTNATRLDVPLDPTKSVHVLAQCCSQIDWPSKRLVSANVQLVLRSRLTSSWVVAPGQQVVVWATSTEGSQPGPVAGATAYLYATSWQGNTTLIGSCVTGGDGSCAVAMPAPSPDMGQTLVGMVQGPNKDLSFTPNAGFWSQPTSTQYVGSLVLDRALVRPGDSLHITGYVAQKTPSKDANALSVKAADVKQALLVVSPGWTGSTGYSTVRADVDPTYGSLHATIPVPSGASMGAFQVTLYIPDANHQSGSIMADAPPVPPAPPVDTAPGPIMVGTPAALPAGPGRRSRALLQAVMPINGKRPGTGSSDGFDASGYSGLSTQSITVSDPRPPTADLTLKAPAWVAPTGKASLSLQAVSYLGSSVAGAAIDITWRTSLAQGLLTVTTDAAGAATATIDLSSLPLVNRSSDGDSLNVNAAWVGPTRERIVRSATVRLQATARRVEFDVTLDTALPGVPFGVNAHVFSNEDNQEIKGVALEVTLKPNSSASGACNTTSTCSFKTGDSAGQQACQLSLPCIGHYVLRVFTNDASPRACANVSLGMNATEWAAQPLSAHMSPKLTLSASQYKLGDTAGLQFQNPWAKATALVLWGNTEQALSRKLFLGLKQGPVTLDIKLGQECRGGCAVMLIVSVPRLPASTIPPGVVVSKLFDPAGAHTFLTTASIEVVEPRKLDVSVSVTSPETTPVDGKAVPVVAPGGSAAVSVSVAKAGQPVGNAEVTLLAVDKAVLDLLPYPLRDLSPELTLSLAASLTGVANDGARLAPGVVDLVFSTLARRLGLDPWLPVDTTVFPNTPYSWSSYLPGYGQYAVDQNDTAYLDLFTSLITYAPNTGGGWRYPYSFEEGALDVGGSRGPGNGLAPSLAAPMPSPVMLNAKRDKANDGSSSSSSSSSVRLASKFVATPLFTVIKTKADGAGQATFKAPANLGTFLVRAYAAQPQLAGLGSAEAPVVVRRKLSLTASIPRITRVGDTFSAGVLVTSPGLPADAPEFLVIIKLKLGGSGKPLKLTSRSPTATAKLSGAKNQVEVRFSFSATRIGSASLTFSANDGRGAVDALGATLPVLAPQSPVFLATSFALKPPSSKTTQWQEGLELPSAVPGTGSLDLLAGVGNLPTILAALNAVTTQRALTRADEPLDAVTSLALAAQAPLLAAYSQQLSSTQQANASDAIAALVSLTDASYGLLPYKPGTWGFYPNRADIVLNAQAVWLLSHLPKYTKGPLASQWQSLLAKQLPTWKSAAVKQLIADATANRNPPFNTQPMPYSDYYTLAWVRLALGGDWEVPQCSSFDYAGLCTSDVQVRSDLSLAALLAAAPEAGLAVQVLLASALQDSSSRATYSTFITTTVNTLVSNFRVQGRTAYIAAYPGARAAASLDLQTFALRLLRAAGGSSVAPLVQKLDAYVAASGAPSNGGHLSFASILPPVTPSPWVVALVCSSLAAYDQAQGSTQPDLSLQARVGTNTVLKATFSKATVGKPPVSSSTPWSKLGPNPGALDFNVQGTGEVSVSAGLTFVPAQPLQFPTYRGVWVSAVIQATDPLSGQPTGPPLAQAPLGSLLTITIQVVTPDDLGAVTLEALVAGGLEPLDPALTSSSDLPATPVCPLIQWLGSGWANVFWGWWWPICPAQEIRPEVVTWKWQRLPAGTSSVVYRAVAATRGTFQLPPIKAYVDDQPEVMGQTASSLFKVCSGAACSAQPAPQAGALPKDCPNDCSGQGACNTSAGTCVCKPGFAGPDCSVQQA